MKQVYFAILAFLGCQLGFANNNLLAPSATISGPTAVCVGAAPQVITFTGSGGTAPYTFTYHIDSGSALTVISSGNTATVTIPNTPGTLVYHLDSVHDNVNPTNQNMTGSVTVVVSAPPTVDFNFSNDNTCSGTTIQFTPSVVGTATYSYAWDFGDGVTSTLTNPTHSFTSLGCGTAPFTVSLTVTGGGCSVTKTKVITVKQKPNLNFTDVINPFSDPFNNCSGASSNPIFSITVGNDTSVTSTCITSFSINWGDGNIENNITFPISHTYPLIGAYPMVITAVGSNGCTNTKSYTIKNVSNPLGGLNSPGSTQNLCAPTANLQFSISNWGANSLDTKYTIDYGDGTPLLILTQNQLVASSYYNAGSPAASANYPIPHIYTTSSCPAASYEVKLNVENACGITPFTLGNISILTKPTADFTAPLNGCVNTSILFTNTTVAGYGQNCAQSAIYKWDFGDGTIITTPLSPPQNISHTYTTTGTFTVTLTVQNFCGTSTKTQTICIEPPLVPQFTISNNSGCVPFSVTTTNTTNLTNQCTTPTYLWQVTHTPANCGSAIAAIPNQTTPNASYNFTEAGTYSIKLTTTNACGSVTSSAQTVNVKRPPIITAISGISANYCGTASINPVAAVTACTTGTLNYTWSFPGGTPFTSTAVNPGPVTYPAGGPYTVSLIVSNECGNSNTQTFNFNVNNAPVVTNSPLSQSICSGTSTTLVNLTADLPGTTFSWTASGVGTTGFLTLGTNTIPAQTITTTANSPGTVTYVVTPSFNGCNGTPVNYIVTVNPAPVVTFSPTPQTLCSGDTSVAVNLSSVAGATLSWSVTPPTGISGVTSTSGSTSIPAQTLTNSTNVPITVTYNASATTSGSSTCAGALYPYTITVKPAPSVTEVFTVATCTGVAFNVTPANSTQNSIPAGTLYSWLPPTGMTGSAGNLQSSITGTLINPTDVAQTATYTVTPITNGCPGATFTVIVTVNPKPSIANITPLPICSGDTFSVTPANGGSTIIPVGTTYTWTVSSNSNVSGEFASSTAGITSISQTLINTSNTNQIVTYTVTPVSGNCSGATFTITVTINPKPTIAAITPSPICSGNSFTVIPSNSGGNIVPIGTTYTWGIPVSNPAGAITGGTDQITGVASISQTLINTTNAAATLSYTVTPFSGNCSGSPFTITVTVNPIPGSLSLSNQLYCNGVVTSPIIFTNSVIGTTYSWTNPDTSIGLSAGGNGDIPSFTVTNTTNSPVVATITVTATANGCARPAETFTITVNPAPTVIFSPAPQTLCSGTTSAVVTLSSTIPGATFNWNVTPPAGITGISTTSGTNTIPAETLVNTTDAPITVTYNATATTASGSTCPGSAYSYTIIVNPIPFVTESFAPIVCSGDNFTVAPTTTTPNSIPAGTTYSWNVPSPISGGMTGGSSGTLQPTITGALNNPTNTDQTATYTVTPISNGCPGTSFSFMATVNPKPVISNINLPAICSNDTFTVTPVNGSDIVPSGTTYTWTVSANTNITGQSASNATGITTISQTLINTSNTSQTITYMVIPVSGNCTGNPFTITITLNPKPTIANVTPAAICSGDSFTVIPSNGGSDIVPLGTTYSWSTPVSNPPGAVIGGSPQNGQAAISQTLTNTTNDIATLTYTVTPVTGTCVGSSFTVTVTLSPIPSISAQSTTICSTNTFTIAPTASGGNIVPLGTTYTWTAPVINPAGALTGGTSETNPQNNISQNLINTTTNPATATYTVTPTSGSCVGNSFTVTVTVNPAINPNVVLTNNACFGVNIASITTNVTGGIPFPIAPPYHFNWSGPGSFTSSASSISNIPPGTYNVTIDDAGNCPFTGTYTITEPADIAITVDSENDVSCYAANNGSINITVTGGTGSYAYTWTKNSSTSIFASTEDIANLGPGTYTVSVTDANNCGPRTMSFTITEPPLMVVNLVSQTNVLCFGASTGAITVNATGGTPGSGYTFSWIGPGGFTSANQNLSAIAAGTYNLTVTDSNNCVRTLSVIVTESPEIIIAYTTTPITCYGANNASLAVTLSGGNPPYTFQWNNLATSLTQTDLSAGNYIITVTDNVNCIQTATITIPEAPVFTVNPIVTNVTCNGAYNGSINLNLTGGIAPVALSWSDGSTAGLIRNNLTPGTYTATISDGTPCYIVRTFTIVQPQPLVVSSNITNSFDCTTTNGGAIDLVVAGGTLPYTYSWSNGSVAEDLANLTSGTYAVIVTDANGCTANASYTIVRQDPIAITVATQTDFDCAAHTVEQNFIAQVSGGIPPYQLHWSSGTISGTNNEIMHSDVNGTVILTVTDSNNCTATYTVTVNNPVLGYGSFDTSSYGHTTYGLYAIGDPIQFESTITGDYLSVSWDFGDGTFSTDLNPVHTYLIPHDYVVTQTVTYPFGCVYVQTISLLVEKGYVLAVPTAFTPNNDMLNDNYRPVTKGLKNVVLDIYDTWGSLIYSETGDVLVGWDGKIKGFNAENGNYYSKVRAETFYGTVVNSNQSFVLIK